MADIHVTIDAAGQFSPETIRVQAGDNVSFAADGADVVLCVSDESIFGADREEIPNGESVTLSAQDGAEDGDFAMKAILDDLNARCRWTRKTTEEGGGGGVGTYY